MTGRNLSAAERERRRRAMLRLHAQGKTRSPLAGRPRRGESAAEARQRREAEHAQRNLAKPGDAQEDVAPLPARPADPPAPAGPSSKAEAEDPRIARAMAAAGHSRAPVSGPPGGPLTSSGGWQTRGAGFGP